jgi:tRNA pseudouridine55 synthase
VKRTLIKSQEKSRTKTNLATPSGLVLVDKPAGWTSHDVVAKMRRIAGTRKVGHAGTLDPMATGLLILGIGSATKLLTFIVGDSKTYQAIIRLGSTTITDDAESEILTQASSQELNNVSPEEIHSEIEKLTGVIEQVPSSVSAIKVDGERAYAKVRAGETVELKSRAVTIYEFRLTGEIKRGENFIDLPVELSCSSGTYIRAIARDLGKALGIGGHLTALRRVRVGNHSIAAAVNIEEIKELSVLPLEQAAQAIFPLRKLNQQEVTDLIHGKRLVATEHDASRLAALGPDGSLVAVLERVDGTLKSLVVFTGAIND